MDRRANRYFLKQVILVICANLFYFSSQAADIVFVLSKDARPYQQFVESVKQSISHPGKGSLSTETMLLKDYIEEPDGHKLVVAVGTMATRGVINTKTRQPVLSTLIPSTVYHNIWKNTEPEIKKRMSGVFIDHPIKRYFNFIKQIDPGWKKVGLLSADSHIQLNREIKLYSNKNGLKLVHRKVKDSDEVLKTLGKVLEESDVLLTLADPVVLNRSTGHGILLSAYHQRVPVISYLKSFVKAGALAALYTTPEDLGKQVGEYILKVKNNGYIFPKQEQYPVYFSIEVNQRVAHSLGLDNIEKEKIKNVLYKIEGIR